MSKMIKILFVCHGNICRSPMAEFVMKKIVRDAGVSEIFEIKSSATSTEEIGNSVYPPVKKLLSAKGIDCTGKTACQIKKSDIDYYDYIVCMDNNNLRNMNRMFGTYGKEKISMLMDYTQRPGSVADPWYTRDFDATWDDVTEGCQGLFEYIMGRR